MKINKDNTIKEIKEIFNESYSGLKIEFYKKQHAKYEGSNESDQYDENLTLSEISPKIQSGEIELTSSQTTKEVELAFENLYGLHVQIFRRSNEIWLQTSTTDDWTLEVQNRKGLHSIQS